MTTLLEALKELKEELIGLDPEKMYECGDDEVFEYICDKCVDDEVEFDNLPVTVQYIVSRGFYAYPNGDPGEPDDYAEEDMEVTYSVDDIIDYFADDIYEAIYNLWSNKFGDRDEVSGKEIMEADWSEINDMIEPQVRERAEELAQEAANDGYFDPDPYDDFDPDWYED